MKHIRKGAESAALRQWREKQPIVNGHRLNSGYRDMPSDVKQAVRLNLLQEQGYLCCYTGRAIDEETSHIEHFKPQSLCEGEEDIDYNNLLAAYTGGSSSEPYGARAKDNWYDSDLLVSPLREGCESKFKFTQFGMIAPAVPSDQSAIETITRLRLNHKELFASRRRVIETVLINAKKSQKQLQTISTDYCKADKNGRFRTYCFVIQQVAQTLLKKSERRTQAALRINKANRDKRKPK